MNAAATASTVARRVRMIGGAILFLYVGSHLLNHALGLFSLQTMEEGRLWFMECWRFAPISGLLYASLTAHLLLALWAVYQRRRLLQMPRLEAAQLVLGLSIVPLLLFHVVSTQGAVRQFDIDDTYTYVLLRLWYLAPEQAAWQAVAVLVAWVHGCMGIHFWLRLKSWYAGATPYLYGAAILIPVLGLLGFAETGRDVLRLAEDPVWLGRVTADNLAGLRGENGAALEQLVDRYRALFTGLLVLTFAARLVRAFFERRNGAVEITYPGGRKVSATPGPTLLEISWINGVPHASVCGGRGRCSTCRVRITRGIETLAPPGATETAVLTRLGAVSGIRLACQIRPRASLSVTPLLPATAGPRDARPRAAALQGREREIAILFADMRSFTKISEHKLPYDVVFMLNRYFAAMGGAIEHAGGHVDKFIGDGVMALFGTGGEDPAVACRQALEAARRMGEALDTLNQTLMNDLDMPLRIGIGVHFGPAIVGEMGHGHATTLTAIGDTVNTASRLETLTKEYGVELVISDDLARRAGFDASAYPSRAAEIRGRSETLLVRPIPRARDILPFTA